MKLLSLSALALWVILFLSGCSITGDVDVDIDNELLKNDLKTTKPLIDVKKDVPERKK